MKHRNYGTVDARSSNFDDTRQTGRRADMADVAAPTNECECKKGMFVLAMTRRRVIAGGGVAAAIGTVGGLSRLVEAATAGAGIYPVPEDPTKEPGRTIGLDGGYGLRSQFETEIRIVSPDSTASFTPLQNSSGIITPSGLHFERHHNGIPNIDPARHRLLIHGMVDRPIWFSLADLKRFPTVSRAHFLECSGNSGTEIMGAHEPTVQRTHGLVSTSEWTGIPLATLLKETGLKPGAAWVLAEGADAAIMTRSVPLDKCLSDALIVFGQNGEALRPEQGYPMRLFLPGWEGNMSIKWLRRLEVSDEPYYTREETSKYTDLITRTGKARIFTFTMEAKSVITFPSGQMKLPGAGFYEISGLAWSGRGKIARVEVSTDAGKSWNRALLQEPVLAMCQTRFRFPWIWSGTPTVITSRATDETGYFQPTHQQLIALRGPLESGSRFYHMNAIQSWGIDADGSVRNVHPFG